MTMDPDAPLSTQNPWIVLVICTLVCPAIVVWGFFRDILGGDTEDHSMALFVGLMIGATVLRCLDLRWE